MLETINAIQFHDAVKSGRTKPSRITCEKSDETLVEVVAKFSDACERKVGSLALEVLGACLAADLGLPVCKPYLVQFAPDWTATVTNSELRAVMQRSAPVAFGSTQAGTGFRAWVRGDRISTAMASTALAIFAFDAFVNNIDRRDANPNCLVKGSLLRIFDHELAFIYKGVLGYKQPWIIGSLAPFATPGHHIFYGELKGTAIDTSDISRAWSSLDNGRLAQYRSAMPMEWSAGMPAVDDAIGLIQGVRDNIDAALAEVRRILT